MVPAEKYESCSRLLFLVDDVGDAERLVEGGMKSFVDLAGQCPCLSRRETDAVNGGIGISARGMLPRHGDVVRIHDLGLNVIPETGRLQCFDGRPAVGSAQFGFAMEIKRICRRGQVFEVCRRRRHASR